MISDEVALVLKGQNLSKGAIDEAIAGLKTFRSEVGLTVNVLQDFNVEIGRMASATRAAIGPQNDLRYVMEATTRAIVDQGAAMRTLGTSAATAGIAGGAAPARTVEELAARNASALRLGSTSIGPASFGGSALGIPVPVIAAAVATYLGYKAVSTANAYNQSITDIVSQSTQDAGTIPGLQSGVLNLTGGQNRFTPQQLVTGLYPIASSPIFKGQADQIAALRVVSAQAQGSGAGSIKALSSADVGAVSAYGFTPSQMQFVADTIQKGVNIGLAESPDFAKGVGTFSAASVAADPNRTRAFQQAIGAYAQQTNLSPRFRFDAQGENAFMQSINKQLTGKSAQLADVLGVSQLFGPGAEGQAGGLQAWLQQFQQATGGVNQQGYLQGLFGRQNALQFVRGFTGSNFASGQIAISGTANAAGTVGRGATIADAGPQAQWDQIGSEFNKKVIELGDTISKTLNPALGTLATQALLVAGKLGDAAGQAGNAVDWFVNHIPGAHGVMPSSIGPQNDLNVRGTRFPVTGPYNDPKNKLYNPYADPNSGYYDPSILTPTQTETYAQLAAQARARAAAQARHVVPAGFMGPLAPGETRAVEYSFMHPAGLGTDQAANAATIAMRQAAANALLTAQSGTNAKILTADRGALNYQLGVGASNTVLNQALATLRTDVGASGMDAASQRNYLQKFGTNPVSKVEDQRLIDAANVQYNAASVFEQAVRIHRDGLGASNAAAQQVYAASMNLISIEAKTGALKKTDAAALGLAAKDTLNQSLLANLSPALQEAQALLSYDQARGISTTGATAQVASLLRQQAALGGMGPNALQLALFQLGQSTGASALPMTNPAQLIRPTTASMRGLTEASFGMSNASLAGGTASGNNDVINALRQQNAYLMQELQTLRSIDGTLKGTATHAARTAKAVTTHAPHARATPLATVRRHR
jgi:hypothetical protein